MELTIDKSILDAYGFTSNVSVTQIGSGHINRTYLLSDDARQQKYVLQQINTNVFKNPWLISTNIARVAEFLKEKHPGYLFPAPLPTNDGALMATHDNEYWRLIPFIENTIALDALFEPVQAYQAAKQFGKLTSLLNDFNAKELKETIPGFHDLNLRHLQFTNALTHAKQAFKDAAAEEISKAQHYSYIAAYYNSFLHRPDFPDRVTHHDTKISNVLLNDTTYEGVCVIDLDTLMPGKFISDLGDMMRTYLSAFTENERDIAKVTVRLPYFEAMISGYLSEMAPILTDTEKELILFSGKYIIYMQALRFLTDYLEGSIYYPAAYPEQNLDRAKNQFKLLSEIYENEHILQDIVQENLNNNV